MTKSDKIFDFDLTVKLVGGKRKAAKEIIDMFILTYLPQHINEIKQALATNDFKQLVQIAHKMHGALCYCGLPRLESATAVLEKALNQNCSRKQIETLCKRVFNESDEVMKAYIQFCSNKEEKDFE